MVVSDTGCGIKGITETKTNKNSSSWSLHSSKGRESQITEEEISKGALGGPVMKRW